MGTKLLFLVSLLLLGCAPTPWQQGVALDVPLEEAGVVFPVEGFMERRTSKVFGQFVNDRFYGYHAGDDVEFRDVSEEVPVVAIADGVVTKADWVSGYGGMMVLTHSIEGRAGSEVHTVSAIYGHLDLDSASVEVGDRVKKGQFLVYLGEGRTQETDEERKHLHFALYEGEELRVKGYVESREELAEWINPQDFFQEQSLNVASEIRRYDPETDLGGDLYSLSFEIPEGWGVEYVPSLEALNLFRLEGTGTARERSQIFIRYFDASDFLTLNSVDVLKREDLTVGQENYDARRYLILKKDTVAEFVDQPAWRNGQHTVTDFRGVEGYTRYYVVAANPDLDRETYERILESMRITELQALGPPLSELGVF